MILLLLNIIFIKIHKTINLPVVLYGHDNLVSSTNGRKVELELESGCNSDLEKITSWGAS
jgi:hypothetical protein